MDSSEDKCMALETAIRLFVSPGCLLSIGGFTVSRNPMAAIHEIIRQGIFSLPQAISVGGEAAISP